MKKNPVGYILCIYKYIYKKYVLRVYMCLSLYVYRVYMWNELNNESLKRSALEIYTAVFFSNLRTFIRIKEGKYLLKRLHKIEPFFLGLRTCNFGGANRIIYIKTRLEKLTFAVWENAIACNYEILTLT